MNSDAARDVLTSIWQAGVSAVDGEVAVAASLALGALPAPDLILAVGKAAVPMARAALAAAPGTPAVAVTKYGHGEDAPAGLEVIEAGHPVPDEGSLRGGARLVAEVSHCGPEAHLWLLVSGGASALAEAPREGFGLEDLRQLNTRLLASGLDIAGMNAERRRYSLIKGGGLLSHFHGARVSILAVSDVRGDAMAVIGGGIGQVPEGANFVHETRIAASNAVARAAAAGEARRLGLSPVCNEETLYGSTADSAAAIVEALRAGPAGVYIWGGEPVIKLPPEPGRGGRNQALALMAAQGIAGQGGIYLLAAGTDGTDGPTDDAGGFADGALWGAGAQDALARADSGNYLEAHGALFSPGPTGTNVMDLVVALKET